jgi:hypothetical protein
MLTIKYNNAEGTVLPFATEFHGQFQNLIESFGKAETDFDITKKAEPPPAGAMGDPVSLTVLIALLIKYKAGMVATTALIKLIIAIRDLYVAFLGKRKTERDRSDHTDELVVEVGKSKLQLPADDEAIREFVEKNAAKIEK